MIVLVVGLLGALLGARNARKQGGGRADMAQYAAAAGIAGLLLGLILTVILERTIM